MPALALRGQRAERQDAESMPGSEGGEVLDGSCVHRIRGPGWEFGVHGLEGEESWRERGGGDGSWVGRRLMRLVLRRPVSTRRTRAVL